jgi:hypothetical protein
MREQSHPLPPMRYQSPAPNLAPSGFRDAVMNAAKAALKAPDITEQDRQLLYDMRRDENRYGFRAIERLFDLLAKLPNEGAAMEFVVDVRTSISRRRSHRRHAAPTVSFANETSAQGAADMAQAEYLRNPTPENAARVRATMSSQMAAIGDFLEDVTVATPPMMRA